MKESIHQPCHHELFLENNTWKYNPGNPGLTIDMFLIGNTEIVSQPSRTACATQWRQTSWP